MARDLRRADVGGAAAEGYTLRRGEGGGDDGPQMHLRRLVLSSKRRPRSAGGIRKPRLGRAASRLTPSVGAIFGATLKSVLDYSGVEPRKRPLLDALRHAARFLAPAKPAMDQCAGADRQHLADGLMAHHVASAQRRGLVENREAKGERSYLGRNGAKDIAVGATAAILVAHYLMSVLNILDADAALAGLERSLARAGALLAGWPVGGGADDQWHVEALRAEERTLGRVRAAAAAATAAATAQRLPSCAVLQLQLDWMRAAAWPRGERCDAPSHLVTCTSLADGEPFGRRHDRLPGEALPPLGTVPLSALPAAAWMSSAASEASSSEDGLSDVHSVASSAASASSAGSSAYDPAESSELTGEDAELVCRVFHLL